MVDQDLHGPDVIKAAQLVTQQSPGMGHLFDLEAGHGT